MDPTAYAWSRTSPTTFRRRALAGECMWISRPKAHHEIFLYASLTLTQPTTLNLLSTATRHAWRRLLYETPELRARATYESDEAYVDLEIPTEDVVSDWVRRTAFVETATRACDGEELRVELLEKKRGFDAEHGFVLLHGVAAQDEEGLTHVDVLLNLDHQITDGIGIRILASRFLSHLAEALSGNSSSSELDWENSGAHLEMPWILAMNAEQTISGPDHENDKVSTRDVIFNKLAQNPSLPLLPYVPPTSFQKIHHISLSASLSFQLIAALKTALGPGTTITHLAHACMLLALLQTSRPPLPHKIHSPCWLNGRRYLVPESKQHTGVCVGFAPVVVDVGALAPAREEESRSVVQATQLVSEQYRKIREQKSMLPQGVQWMEDVGRIMWNTSQQRPKVIATSPPGAEPFLLSDGITEQYIAHSYPSQLPEKVFEVDSVTFHAHAEHNLIVRISSWRGRTTVSGEWQEKDYDEAFIVAFLQSIVTRMEDFLREAGEIEK